MTHPANGKSSTKVRVFSLIGITLIVAAAMFVFFGPTDNWLWDPSYYYALLRSPIIDGDLDIAGEVQPPQAGGNLTNTTWPLGPSILWSPFFLVAHLGVSILKPTSANGLSSPYIALVSLGSALYGGLGLWVVYKTCRLFADRFLALAAALLCIGATPLFFYVFRQPIMAHTVSFFACASLIYIYLRLEQNPAGIPEEQSGLLLGAFSGLCLLTRWAGGLILIFPIAFFLGRIITSLRQSDRHRFKTLLYQILIFMIAFLIAVSPQMMYWYQLSQQFILSPQGTVAFVNSVLPVNVLNLFINTNRGVIFWAPYVLLGLIGLFWLPNRKIKIIMLVYAAMAFVLFGYRVDWYGGGGFGARYLIELLPVVAVGFVSLWKKIQSLRLRNSAVALATLILIVHQLVLLHAVEHAIEPGWVDLSRYTNGEQVGMRFQLESLLRVIREPATLLSARPAVDQGRQTLLVNLIQGERRLQAYLIPGIAFLAALILLPLLIVLLNFIQKISLRGVTLILLLYLLGWTVFLSTI